MGYKRTATEMTVPEFIRLFEGYLGKTELVKDAYDNAERFHTMLHGSKRYKTYESFRSTLYEWHRKRYKNINKPVDIMESETREMIIYVEYTHWEGGFVIPFLNIRIGGKKVVTKRPVTSTFTTIDFGHAPREVSNKTT